MLSIIWTSVLLYNVIDRMDGIRVIGSTMTRLVRDPLAQSLVVGWAFSGFMQGVAGFGVPVAVVAPLMVLMGFRPARAAAIVLVGHAWAVTFGSLGSSYYTIQLVSGIDGDVIGPHMAAMFALPIVVTGFAVAHLEGGLRSVRRGAPIIVIMGAVMAGSVWFVAAIGAPQIASIVSGLVGCGVGWAVARTWLLPGRESDEAAASNDDSAAPAGLGFHVAFLPYYLLISLSVVSQIPAVKELGASWHWGLDYPAVTTALGFEVDAQDDYARIRLLRHPAPLILASLALTWVVYRVKGCWRPGAGVAAARRTYDQCVSTSVGVATMVMMAVVMTDTGMTVLLGRTIADGTGVVFPPLLPLHRRSGHVHDRQQHQLERDVRRAAARDRQGVGDRGGDRGEHAVDRRLPRQLDRARQGAGRHGHRGPLRPRERGDAAHDTLLPPDRGPGRHPGMDSHQAAGRRVTTMRERAKQVALGVMAADFPLLYVGAVTLEDAVVSAVALAVMAVAAAVAAIVY